MNELRPLADKVLIQKIQKKQETAGGIILPESAIEDSNPVGIVIAVGPRVNDIKKDDLVLYLRYTGHSWKDNELILVKEDEILGVIENVQSE